MKGACEDIYSRQSMAASGNNGNNGAADRLGRISEEDRLNFAAATDAGATGGEYAEEVDTAEEIVDDDGGEPMDEEDDDYDAYEDVPDDDEDGGQHGGIHTEDIVDDSIQGFFDHREPVYSIAISPTNNNVAASGGGDDNAYLWRISDGSTIAKLQGHTDSVISLAFNHDGSLLASGGMDGAVRIWRAETGELVHAFTDDADDIAWLAWHPRGNVVIAGAEDGNVFMWNAEKGRLMVVMSGLATPSMVGQFTPNGQRVIAAAEDGTLAVWSPPQTTPSLRLAPGTRGWLGADVGPITAIGIREDSGVLLAGGVDGSLRLVNLTTGSVVATLESPHEDSIESIAFNSESKMISVASTDGTISIWDASTNKLRHTLQHDDAVVKLIWFPQPAEPTSESRRNAHILFSASTDGSIRSWDSRTGAQLRKWTGHLEGILDFAVSHDGKILISGSDDGTSLVFDNN
ncbi:WD40 repeat-like protein [Ramicandelaber brevisporus]|nr:WD40 repeat-like protein [Ramicandelaber brevisporus]